MIGDRLHRVVVLVGLTLALMLVLATLLAVGAVIPSRPGLALAASGAVLVLGVTALQPTAVPMVAAATLLVVHRLAIGGTDLSVSDAVLFVALWPALLFARRGYSQKMRTILWLIVLYQVSTLFTVIANPYFASVLDWLHSGMLAGGALIVGWAIGRQGQARLGISLLLVLGGVLAVSTIVQGVQQYAGGDLAAVYTAWPYPMHKNFVGTTLAAIAVIAYVHPSWVGWSRGAALTLFWLCAAAILFSQSRQALLSLGITLIFIVLRRDPERTRSKVVLAVVPPTIALVAITIKQQIDSGNQFSSVQQRLTWLGDSIDVWRTSPIFGAGLRWWYSGRFPTLFQPPNAELEVLTTAGVVGLLAFLALFFGALTTLTKLDPHYGTLAVAILFNRFVQGQFDIFWVSVAVSLPFFVVGVCLGAEAFHEAEEPSAALRPGTTRAEVSPT